MTAAEIEQQYVKVSTAARELAANANFVYRQLQSGKLRGLCIDGQWSVERASLEKLKKARAVATVAATS
jgi:hypothetical protein